LRREDAQIIEGELSPIRLEDASIYIQGVSKNGEHRVVSRERDRLHRIVRVVFFGFKLSLLDSLKEEEHRMLDKDQSGTKRTKFELSVRDLEGRHRRTASLAALSASPSS
jgi:hypothetical protein